VGLVNFCIMHVKGSGNHLLHETSPYLLQHAYNPVDWFPWGEESLEKAKAENKPILVSIGYSACHWCHVMERESFEDQVTAQFMNEHFVNIKIDREERPDLDHIYMDAVQAMTGSGGWPLNVFLTPDCRPFYGGTYFPPVAAGNRPSWMDVLAGVSRTFNERPEDVYAQAGNMTEHILQTNGFGQNADHDGEGLFTKETLETITTNLLKSADRVDGGFGRAPKFPQTFSIHYLLEQYHYTGDTEALKQARLSLDKMMYGGIYDQLGGGFARYSTDAEWLAPHFEKMLYDNALLLMVYAEAYQITHDPDYERIITETVGFIKNELTSPQGMFYSALDADSEGEEGRFYVWTRAEINEVLGGDAELFSEFYDITEEGNWEGHNIPRILEPMSAFSEARGLDPASVAETLDRCRQILFDTRSKRVRPGLDDKIILGWNALMISALCKASAATGDKEMMNVAVHTMAQLESNLQNQLSGDWNHTWKNNLAKYPAFLDDYGNLIQAYIQLQELTGEADYLLKARQVTEFVLENFADEEGIFFYYTHKNQKDVIIRKKEIYDGAVPAGNSIMAWNLLYLSVIFDKGLWRTTVVNMLNSIGQTTVKFPGSFGNWAAVMHKITHGVLELVITGNDPGKVHDQLLTIFMPNRVLQSASREVKDFPLLQQKSFESELEIYLCKNYSCFAPVNNVNSLIRLLDKDRPFSLTQYLQ
jgi:uncharacterized protein YyaL (SSP411 family)